MKKIVVRNRSHRNKRRQFKGTHKYWEIDCGRSFLKIKKIWFWFWNLFSYIFIVDTIAHVTTLPTFSQLLLPLPSGHHHTVVCVHGLYICSLANSFTFRLVLPQPNSCHSVPCIHASVSILFLSLFCSLDSTC